MAGLGRRTHYRKHLTDSVLHDLPEPHPPHSQIAKIVATRGSNQFDVHLVNGSATELAILPSKFRKLVWLKRNDYVIVATADNVEVIVETFQDDDDDKQEQQGDDKDHCKSSNSDTPPLHNSNNNDSGGIRCMITHILYQDQIKHLIAKGMWPTDDPDFVVDDRKTIDAANLQQQQQQSQASQDGIVYDAHYLKHNKGDERGEYRSSEEDDALSGEDPSLFVNTNRIARLTVQDSSSDEEDEDD